jgi:hypothetical protein
MRAFDQPGLLQLIYGLINQTLLPLIPLTIGVAMLRFRLWDIEVLINRTLVYSILTVGIEACRDLLIGADGLHSVIRSQLSGVSDPRYSGYTCWRGVAQITRTGLETWAWGKVYQFGAVPMSHGRAYWFAQKDVPEGEQDRALGKKQAKLALFKDWHDPIPAGRNALVNDVGLLEAIFSLFSQIERNIPGK